MKLQDIHTNFNTDKGTAHNYIDTYEALFSSRRLDKLNILEIGVLFGGSLKMWEHYFPNSMIYGVEDFSQDNGHEYHAYAPVIAEQVKNDLRHHERIKLEVFNCENPNSIAAALGLVKFDIIIDDASHALKQQFLNMVNYYPLLSRGGFYICEDVQSHEEGCLLITKFKSIFNEYETVELIEMSPPKKSDDRIILIKK